jgi:hypothetical protein
MGIAATTPTTSVATTFNQWWMTLNVSGSSPNSPVPVQIVLRKYGVGTDGNAYFDPNTPPAILTLPDLFAAMASDSDLAGIVNSLLAKVQSMAQAKGLI